MTAFTRLGSSLWDWEPWRELSMPTRNLWLALYTSGEAKRHVPGLWQGSIPSMSDAARMRPDDTVDSLDDLLTRELVEYDPKTRVLRLTELPDAGEWPQNGKVILSWWRRFETVPNCGVRNAHVPTIRWLLDHGAKSSGKKVTPHHEEAWAETFAQVQIPSPRRRGMRRLSDDSDTSTRVQPSLFPSQAPLSGHDPRYPQNSQVSVDNSAVLRQQPNINHLDTVSHTVRIPDPDPDTGIGSLSSSGEPAPPRRTLTLVPGYSVEDVVDVMRGGRWEDNFSKTHQDELRARFDVWLGQRVTLEDFRFLAQASREFGDAWDARVLATADIPDRIRRARRRASELEERMRMLDEFRPQLEKSTR